MLKSNIFKKFWDKMGICASTICLVHCLLTPIILLLYPASDLLFIESEIVHQVLGIIVISSALFAVYPHCHRHGHKDILAYAFLGAGFILIGIFAHDFPEYIGHGFTILGSISLITAHLKNMRVRHGKCETDHTHDHHSHHPVQTQID